MIFKAKEKSVSEYKLTDEPIKKIFKRKFKDILQIYIKEFAEQDRDLQKLSLPEIKEEHNFSSIQYLENIGAIDFLSEINSNYDVKLYLAGGSLRRLFEYNGYNERYDFDFYISRKYHHDYTTVLDKTFNFFLDRDYSFHKDKDIEGNNFWRLRSHKSHQEVQIINFLTFEDAWELIGTFDFTPCQFAFDGDTLFTYTNSIEDVLNKKLDISSMNINPNIFKRLMRYTKKYNFDIKDEKMFYKKYDLIKQIDFIGKLFFDYKQDDSIIMSDDYKSFRKARQNLLGCIAYKYRRFLEDESKEIEDSELEEYINSLLE